MGSNPIIRFFYFTRLVKMANTMDLKSISLKIIGSIPIASKLILKIILIV